MASSRWKRFAFFDRHTLTIPSAVVENFTPAGERRDVSSSSSPSRRSTTTATAETMIPSDSDHDDDNVSMVVTTASLPATTKPEALQAVQQQQSQHEQQQSQQQEEEAIAAMWSSLMACTSRSTVHDEGDDDEDHPAVHTKNVVLPNQQQQQQQQSAISRLVDSSSSSSPTSSSSSSSSSSDGLVLLWIASPASPLVHCLDVTVRSTSFGSFGKKQQSPQQEDLDGWRGYYAAFSTTTTQQQHKHNKNNNIVGLATCRVAEHLHVAALASTDLVVHVDPHLHLSCRLPLQQQQQQQTMSSSLSSPSSQQQATTMIVTLATPWKESSHGRARVLDMIPGHVAVGTDTGTVLLFSYDIAAAASAASTATLSLAMAIPAPPHRSVGGVMVTSVRWSSATAIFVSYEYDTTSTQRGGGGSSGICCFELSSVTTTNKATTTSSSSPLARHDLDGRHVASALLCDGIPSKEDDNVTINYIVARPDGLYTYSRTQKMGVSPIDGAKHCMCATEGYALVASTDTKSGRDAVDIYDSTHKLVAFHVLLSPGHKALNTVAMTLQQTKTTRGRRAGKKKRGGGGRSIAFVLTSGGSIVSLIEKDIGEKVSLLVQKNLYSAAISIAYADPSYQPADITALYRRHAEHLYRKGDFSAAMDQYIYTIGSLESSHVIFRYLDAPKIPLLAKYLEELRSRDLATPVHNELLRTCYLKLNDNEAAEKIAAFASSSAAATSSSSSSCVSSLVASLSNSPKEALATVCALEAPQAAESLVIYGASLARAFPRETAGLVVALCLGTYSPNALKELTLKSASSGEVSKMLEYAYSEERRLCDPYPVHLFAPAFVEHPKMLRLILAHCNRSKCLLTPTLRRTLLELTLEEWNDAKRTGDTEAEKLRRKEAIAALTDAHCTDIGDYDALVIVQLAGFSEGELLLYERLQMTPMLLARYAQDGGNRARRHMLAMCRSDPEILADVLGHFVAIASERIHHDGATDDTSTNSEEEEILDDIREALLLAKTQGALPPVRIARILAGEGVEQFSVDSHRTESQKQQTVPLSVALDYVGAILDDSRQEISRLKGEVEEYNQLCNSMEEEVNSLLRATLPPIPPPEGTSPASRINIDEMHAKLRSAMEERHIPENKSEFVKEAFWREMNQSEDRFETIARFFAKGVIQ